MADSEAKPKIGVNPKIKAPPLKIKTKNNADHSDDKILGDIHMNASKVDDNRIKDSEDDTDVSLSDDSEDESDSESESDSENDSKNDSDSESDSKNDSDNETEIEILKGASPEELYQLLASDPAFYLKLIENHKSPDENLGQRFRCLLSRNDNDTLNIKFKIFPTDRWTEIGYFEDMSDQDVYHDFTSHVDALLSRSSAVIEKNRSHLSSEIGEENDISSQKYKGKLNPDMPVPDWDTLQHDPTQMNKIKANLASIQANFRQAVSVGAPVTSTNVPGVVSPGPVVSSGPGFPTGLSKEQISSSRGTGTSVETARRVHHFTKGPLGHYAVKPKSEPISPPDFQRFPPKQIDESLSPPPIKKPITLDVKLTERLERSERSERLSANLAERTNANLAERPEKSNLKDELTAYEQQLIEQMVQQMSVILSLAESEPTGDPTVKALKSLMKQCPVTERSDFQRLINHLSNRENQNFYREYERIVKEAPSYYQPLLRNFISRAWSNTDQSRVYLDPYIYTHRDVLACLELDEIDRKLIQEHKINLVRLWNQHLSFLQKA